MYLKARQRAKWIGSVRVVQVARVDIQYLYKNSRSDRVV
jgi:hypothetical protein